MNTLSASKQFKGRLENAIGRERIIEFNSSPSGTNPARNMDEVLQHIERKNIKAIICCAHETKIRLKIPRLLDYLSDPRKNYKIIIHVDEAHKYITENRADIRNYNDSPIVTRIIGYSASPMGIWNTDTNDAIFYKIHIRDIEKEFGLFRSKHYFGVKDCDVIYSEPLETDVIPLEIPKKILKQSGGSKTDCLYADKFPFTIGNEQSLLVHIKMTLPKMKICPNTFSYHYIPAYTRKITHYYACSLILDQFPNANVIVINGNGGIQLFRNTGQIVVNIDKDILEPSERIERMIRGYSSCPTFVTGFHCVGMSVTLINETLGNFDSVILNHTQYNPDILYQLCRFLFNYASWKNTSHIKKTRIYALSKEVIETCLQYEDIVDDIVDHHSGSEVTLRDIDGREPSEPTSKEKKKLALSQATVQLSWKRFKVYDQNDESQWNAVQTQYEDIRGKSLTDKSRPKKIGDYYHCSTTKNIDKHSISQIQQLQDHSWWSTFQLVNKQYRYVRIFVGYDCLDDPTQYTIYLKCVILEENEYNKNLLKEYGKE
jgi:hypothetical protein